MSIILLLLRVAQCDGSGHMPKWKESIQHTPCYGCSELNKQETSNLMGFRHHSQSVRLSHLRILEALGKGTAAGVAKGPGPAMSLA